MDRIELLDKQIEIIKNKIQSDYFTKELDIFVDGRFASQIKGKLNDYIPIIAEKYPTAVDSLSYFVKLILKMLNKYEEHIKVKAKIQHLWFLKNEYKYFCYKEYGELKAKIDTAIEQLQSIKKNQLATNICPKHVKLFNLLNDEDFTNYSDVIDYKSDDKVDGYIQRNTAEKVEKIATDGLVSIQQINYLINNMKLCKRILKQKKGEAHTKISDYGKLMETNRVNDIKLWPKFCKKTENLTEEDIANKKAYDTSVFVEIDNYIKYLDEKSLSLIVAFCAQFNFLEMTGQDISGRPNKIILRTTTNKAYISYIRQWRCSFKQYLDMHMGGTC